MDLADIVATGCFGLLCAALGVRAQRHNQKKALDFEAQKAILQEKRGLYVEVVRVAFCGSASDSEMSRIRAQLVLFCPDGVYTAYVRALTAASVVEKDQAAGDGTQVPLEKRQAHLDKLEQQRRNLVNALREDLRLSSSHADLSGLPISEEGHKDRQLLS